MTTRNHRQARPAQALLTRVVAVAALAATLVATSGGDGASATGGCETARSYGFATVVNDPPWASVVGHVELFETATGSFRYTLTVTDQQARYARESIAAGCEVAITYQTRATTGAMGRGSAWFDATVEVGGGGASGGTTESGVHPLGQCDMYGLVCQENAVYSQAIASAPEAGDVLTVSGTGTVTADAGETRVIDQAHADWRVRYATLVIPVP